MQNWECPIESPDEDVREIVRVLYENKIIRSDTKTIIRIHNGNRLYGTLRISNMIPVPITELEPHIVSNFCLTHT